MRVLILICWVFAGTVERSVLQPSQNVSVEGESWVEQSSLHLQQHPAKEEEESESRIPVSVTAEETDGLHSERTVGEEDGTLTEHHGTLTEEEGKPVGKRGERDEENEEEETREVRETELIKREEDRAGDADGGQETFNDPGKYGNENKIAPVVKSEDLYQTVPPPTLHQSLNQYATSSPSQYESVILSSITTQSPPSHLPPVTNVTNLMTNGASETVAYTVSGRAKPRPMEKVDATLSVMAARAGPTATSMPRSFRTEPRAGITEVNFKNKQIANMKNKKKDRRKEKKTNPLNKGKKAKKLKREKVALTTTTAPYFPYFKDNYCPPACACYGRVVQCSDKGLDKIPYGIPYNSRYILLMNNRIDSIAMGLLSEYLSMEFLVLTNNRLTDISIRGAFEGIHALKRLHLERNILQSVPADLPSSLEELRLDGNGVMAMTKETWACCSGLLILSLSNNSLGSRSLPLPAGVLSLLGSLRILSLSHNRLTSVPLHLPLSLQELYLRGNLIQRFQGAVFQGEAELQVLDLSANRLTNKGLGKTALINATHLESLNLEGNFLKQIPQHLPRSLKILNLERNSISAISKTALLSLPHLEHLGLAHNKIARVSPGAFRMLPQLHQLDLSHNALQQVPRQLPQWLVTVSFTHNKIRIVPRDAFCSASRTKAPYSRLVRIQLENNLVDMGNLDNQAFSCLRGSQVVHFY